MPTCAAVLSLRRRFGRTNLATGVRICEAGFGNLFLYGGRLQLSHRPNREADAPRIMQLRPNLTRSARLVRTMSELGCGLFSDCIILRCSQASSALRRAVNLERRTDPLSASGGSDRRPFQPAYPLMFSN